MLKTYSEGTYQIRVYFFSNAKNIWTKELKLPPVPDHSFHDNYHENNDVI